MDDFVLPQVLSELELVGMHRSAGILFCSADKGWEVLLIFIAWQMHVSFGLFGFVLFTWTLERSLFLQLLLTNEFINSRGLKVLVVDNGLRKLRQLRAWAKRCPIVWSRGSLPAQTLLVIVDAVESMRSVWRKKVIFYIAINRTFWLFQKAWSRQVVFWAKDCHVIVLWNYWKRSHSHPRLL